MNSHPSKTPNLHYLHRTTEPRGFEKPTMSNQTETEMPQPKNGNTPNGVAPHDKNSGPTSNGHHIENSSLGKRTHMLNKTTGNDPLSHRIIEKRRRDRMNNCLADLSKLIPSYYMKKSRGRIEKTEIIEMAIKYLKHLQAHACNQIETCEVTAKQERLSKEIEHFHMGYQDCMNETLEFLRDSEGLFSGDSLCVRLMNHLTKHCEGVLKNEGYLSAKQTCSSSSSSSSGYHPNGSSTGSSSDGNGSSNNNGDTKENEDSAYPSTERFFPEEREEGISCSGTPGSLDSGFCGVSEGSTTSLRDIIQHQINPVTMERLHPNYLTSSGPASNNSSSGEDNNNRLYKFKSNMKHRFNVDLEHLQGNKKMRRDSSSSCGFSSNYEKERHPSSSRSSSQSGSFSRYQKILYDSAKFIDEGSASQGSSGDSMPFIPPHLTTGKPVVEESVPIFVLNQKGSFYVPFAIGYSHVAAALSSNSELSSILHPISIYVSFPSPAKPILAAPEIHGNNSPRGSVHGGAHTSPYHSSQRPRSRANHRKESADNSAESSDDPLKISNSSHPPSTGTHPVVNLQSRFYSNVPFSSLEKRDSLPHDSTEFRENSLLVPTSIGSTFPDSGHGKSTPQPKGTPKTEGFETRTPRESDHAPLTIRSNRTSVPDNPDDRIPRDTRPYVDYPESYLTSALQRDSKFIWPYHIPHQSYQA